MWFSLNHSDPGGIPRGDLSACLAACGPVLSPQGNLFISPPFPASEATASKRGSLAALRLVKGWLSHRQESSPVSPLTEEASWAPSHHNPSIRTDLGGQSPQDDKCRSCCPSRPHACLLLGLTLFNDAGLGLSHLKPQISGKSV